MKYTEELEYIQERISELRIKTDFSRNTLLVKFLDKYKEFMKTAITNNFKINKR